jgi:hypothetical protein
LATRRRDILQLTPGFRDVDVDRPELHQRGPRRAGGHHKSAGGSKDVRDEAVRHQSEGGDARKPSNRQFLGPRERLADAADSSRFTGDFRRTVKTAGLNLRQAYYLCEIVDQLRPFARYKERFEAIGWTKTQAIARGLNRQNLKERLELAEAKDNSTRKLQSLMKGETPPSEARRVVLYFTKDDYGVFEKAVARNGGSIGRRGNLVDKEAAVLALIKKATSTK